MELLSKTNLIFNLFILLAQIIVPGTPASADIKLRETGGGAEYVGFDAPASIAVNKTWILPTADGAPNQCLATDGSANLIWVTPMTSATGFINGGNSFGAATTLGTNDGQNLGFRSNNTVNMTLDTSGRLGVGTTSPTAALHVSGVATADKYAAFGPSGAGSGADGFNVGYAGFSYGPGISFLNAHSSTNNAGTLVIATDGVEKMRLGPTGNLSIGTTTAATQKLQVVGSGVDFGSAGAGAVGNGRIIYQPGSPVSVRQEFGTDGTLWQYRIAQNNSGTVTDIFTIQTGGSVGIGTTAPAAQLTIRGAAQASTALNPAGSLGGTLLLHDAGSSGGNGGTLLFAASNDGTEYTAAIKGLQTSSSASSDIAVGDLAFSVGASTSDSTLSERMRIKGNGNVGIGTTNPAGPLDVRANVAAEVNVARFENSHASGYTGVQINRTGNLRYSLLKYTTAGTDDWVTGIPYGAGSPYSDYMIGTGISFTDAKITVQKATGNVGIGTTSPTEKLEVVTGGNVKMGWQRVVSAGQALAGGGTGTESVSCPAGKYIMSGGCSSNGGGYLQMIMSYPGNDTSWNCSYINTSGSAYTMYAHAICANMR